MTTAMGTYRDADRAARRAYRAALGDADYTAADDAARGAYRAALADDYPYDY